MSMRIVIVFPVNNFMAGILQRRHTVWKVIHTDEGIISF